VFLESLNGQLGSIMMRGMVIDMNDEQLQTLAELRAFLDGTVTVDFAVAAVARYDFIARTVRRFGYGRLKRADKAVVLRFLERVSGYSRQQLSRLVQRGGERRPLVKRYRASRTSFARTYTSADVLLLAHTDTLHGTLSGLATKKLMERAYRIFGDARYARLAAISVAHLYNLRQRAGYQRHRRAWTKTRPVPIAIGQRRAPAPNNQPGYLRVDSVCQGDQDGVKGLYHINAVDCVTQYEGVATCERISEAFLIPVLEALLHSFPFVIRGFHSDNGSEYINHQVAQLLNKLLIEEQTKSRSRHSNDNAQAESKNGSIVRKHLGYSHIPQRFAPLVNAFCRDHLNPYVNFHRPCLFAETVTDAKGRQRKRYPYKLMMTPYDKLKSLPKAEPFLKPGITFAQLDVQATAMSDNDAAQRLNDARAILFRTIFNRSKTAA
jgi:transposase InsO family protein